VPAGIDLLGFFRSPLMLAPAKIPAVAGNKIPNRSCQFSLQIILSKASKYTYGLTHVSDIPLPVEPLVKCGIKFSFSVCTEIPVYTVPEVGSLNGDRKKVENGMENVARRSMANNRFDARANIADPSRHITVQNTRTAVA
jgi:hypothetical protein